MRTGLLVVLALAAALPAVAQQCEKGDAVAKHGKNSAYKVDGALVWTSPVLKIDADGAPNAYRLDGKGLSYTCDGVFAIENGVAQTQDNDERGWQAKCNAGWAAARESGDYTGLKIVGFETAGEKNAPIVQAEGDPLPGEAFITTTFVNVSEAPEGTQRRYVDATAIPFIVLPGSFRSNQSVKDAALAAIWRPKSETLAFAVFGDTGGKLDEASVRLHEDLGSKPVSKVRGTLRAKTNIEDPVMVVLFPAEASAPRLDAEGWRAEIKAKGEALLAAWGGLGRLKACFAN